MTAFKIDAGSKFPDITVPRFGGGKVTLGKPSAPFDWKMVVVYRGKHCPLCTAQLKELNDDLQTLNELGVDVVAVSGDPLEKVEVQMKEVAPKFTVGYDLSIEDMKKLGLYISDPRSPEETDQPFAEPGIFIINGDGNVQILNISNAPFSRPSFKSLAGGIKFVRNPDNNYPIRGTHK